MKAEVQSNASRGGAVVKMNMSGLLPAGTVAVIAFAVYFNSLFNGFVYDDAGQVLQNPWIRDFRFLPDIFRKGVWSFLPGHSTSNFYRPMMHVIYMLTYYLFGLKPWGFHLVNVLFHAANSVLVFIIVSRLFADKLASVQAGKPASEEADKPSNRQAGKLASLQACEPASWQADKLLSSAPFIAALLFATHPIHAEAVVWVAGLPDVSYAFFFLLSFSLYIRSRDGRTGSYLMSLAAFLIAVLCKEPALTLPLVLIAYDTALGPKDGGRHVPWRGWLPYFLICGLYLFLRMQALKGFTAYVAFGGLTPFQYIVNVFPLFAEYLKDLFLPMNLRFWHTFHPLSALLSFKGVLSLIVSILFAAAALLARKKDRILFIGMVLLVVPLLPAFYIQGIFGKPYAERYVYLPSAGFTLILALFFLRLREASKLRGKVAVALALLLSVLFSLQTVQRNTVWKSDLTLFKDTVAKAPDAALPRRQLANALLNEGDLEQALAQYRIAMDLDPASEELYKNMAIALTKKGMKEEAVSAYKKAVSLEPGDLAARRGLADAYAASGLTDEAIAEYRAVLNADPGSPEAYTGLGLALAKKGLNEEAARSYLRAIAADPDYAAAHYNLGSLYANSGRMNEALAHFQAAVRLEPDNAFFRNVLGITYGDRGMADAAVAEFEAAVRLAPEEQAYRRNLEKALRLRRPARPEEH